MIKLAAIRHRLRISLMALMALVLAVACWLGYIAHLAREQGRAVAAIRAYVVSVAYDWEFVGGKRVPGRAPRGPAWLRQLFGDDYFQTVVQVDLVYWTGRGPKTEPTRPGDDIMEAVGQLPGLLHLFLQGEQGTDRSMDVVSRLRALTDLVMYSPNITDAGIAKLTTLRRLERLGVSDAGLTDQSMGSIVDFPRLRILAVQGNQITNEGLALINRNPAISLLFLAGNPATKGAVDRLPPGLQTDLPDGL